MHYFSSLDIKTFVQIFQNVQIGVCIGYVSLYYVPKVFLKISELQSLDRAVLYQLAHLGKCLHVICTKLKLMIYLDKFVLSK